MKKLGTIKIILFILICFFLQWIKFKSWFYTLRWFLRWLGTLKLNKSMSCYCYTHITLSLSGWDGLELHELTRVQPERPICPKRGGGGRWMVQNTKKMKEKWGCWIYCLKCWGEWGDGGYHRRGPSVVSCWAIFYTNISLKGIHLPLMPLLLNFPTLGRERGARQDITRAIQRTIHTVVCQSISGSLVRCLLLDWITYIYDVYIVRDLKG